MTSTTPPIDPGENATDEEREDYARALSAWIAGNATDQPDSGEQHRVISDSARQGSLDVGEAGRPQPKAPTHAELTIGGLSNIELSVNAFRRAEYIRGEFVARIESSGEEDKMDRAEGVAVDTIRQLRAHAYDIRLLGTVSSPQLEESDVPAALKAAVAAARDAGLDDTDIRGILGLKA